MARRAIGASSRGTVRSPLPIPNSASQRAGSTFDLTQPYPAARATVATRRASQVDQTEWLLVSDLIGPEGAGIGAALWTGRKVLGSLLDEVAEDIRERYASRRRQTFHQIIEKAAKRLGPAAEIDGAVPPRLIGLLIDEASWVDDEVLAEYWGGIVAASRTAEGKDDHGIPWARLVARLSRFHVKAHYLL